MSITSKIILAAATSALLLSGSNGAEAGRLRFLHFPHIFPPYDSYDPYYDDPAYDGGDVSYADPGDVYDDSDPYYVPRRHKRHVIIEQDVNPWWLDPPPPSRKLKSTRALEPVPYHKPATKKKVVASAPVPKLAPVKKKLAPLALAPETKPTPAKPEVTTASLTPAKPVAKTPATSKTIGCTAGAAIVTGYGFANVTPKTCTGAVYAYNAQRDGKPYVIKLTAAQGEITEVAKQ